MKNNLYKLLLVFLLFLIIINKDVMYITIYKTTLIWFENIVPNLFPLFIITSLLIQSNIISDLCNLLNTKLYKYLFISPYSLFVFIISLFTGMPSNAKYIKDGINNNIITKEEANRLIVYSSNYNPLLIIKLLSSFLSIRDSLKILFTIIISNVLLYIINYKRYDYVKVLTSNNKINLSNIIKNTIDILLMILGVLIIFNLLVNIIPIRNELFKNILNGFLEITTALYNIKYINVSRNIIILLSLVYLSFGGLSIHIQIKSILPDTDYKFYFKNKLWCICINIVCYYAIIRNI